MNNLFNIATKRPLYVTDGIEIVRTVPTNNPKAPFVGYIKTTNGEACVAFSNKTLTDTMYQGGREITKAEYERLPVLCNTV